MSAPTTIVPPLTAPRRPARLRADQVVLDNGLTVVAVRKPGVPIVELRLRVPFLSGRRSHPAQATVLAETLMTGAAGLDRSTLASAVQALGGDLSASVDADRLVLVGNVLATNLRKMLDLVNSVLVEPTYDRDEVETERGRLIENLTIARARSAVIASEALANRMWPDHPYARDLAQPDDVAAVTPGQLRSLHRSMVRPAGGVLVLVGDLAPARMLDQAATALASWSGAAPSTRVPPLPNPPAGALQVADRPGSVQSSFRFARPAVGRTDADYPALYLANLIFGGFFSSRWTENLREDKGYTYGPHSRIDHHVLGSTLTLTAEVQTEVTAPALLETLYELGRIAALPVTDAEVDDVRQYAIGTLALSTSSQAGLASTLSGLFAFGLGLEWISTYPAQLQAVTVDEVSAAATRFFGPSGFTSVVVGDAETIADPLSALVPVER